MIKKIIIGLLIIIIGTLVFSYFWNKDLPQHLEDKYNTTQDYNDLISLCRNLYSTNNYNKQIKYYSKMLTEKETFINARKESKDPEKEYSIYTVWYLRALLHNQKYDKYKSEFNNYFYKLNSLTIVSDLYKDYISNNDFSKEELNIILQTAEENLKTFEDMPNPSQTQINRYKTLQIVRYSVYLKIDKDKAQTVLDEQNNYLKNINQNK